MLLSANAKLPGEMINAQQGEVPGPKGKKHSLVFGRSLRSPSPSIMKRSASVNDQQRPMELGLGGIDEIAQMNAKNSAHKQPPVKRRDPNPKKFF
jgi:hypothetical protein